MNPISSSSSAKSSYFCCFPKKSSPAAIIAATTLACAGAGAYAAWMSIGFIPSPAIAISAALGAIVGLVVGIAIATFRDYKSKVNGPYTQAQLDAALHTAFTSKNFIEICGKVAAEPTAFRVNCGKKELDDTVATLIAGRMPDPKTTTANAYASALKLLFRESAIHNPACKVTFDKTFRECFLTEYERPVALFLKLCLASINPVALKTTEDMAKLIAPCIFAPEYVYEAAPGEDPLVSMAAIEKVQKEMEAITARFMRESFYWTFD